METFPLYWPFVWGVHRSPGASPHKGRWRGALMFSLICTRINGWVNNGEAGDLRRHLVHYNVTVMHSASASAYLRQYNPSYDLWDVELWGPGTSQIEIKRNIPMHLGPNVSMAEHIIRKWDIFILTREGVYSCRQSKKWVNVTLIPITTYSSVCVIMLGIRKTDGCVHNYLE